MEEEFLKVCRGEEEADLLLLGGLVVNVFTGEIAEHAVAVHGGRIAGFGERPAREVLDLKGAFLCPGFIDGHVHIESSMVTLPEFARAVVPRGTTAVVTDYHEIANVLGTEGLRYMMDLAEGLPLDALIMLPSCVPATPMETSGAVLEVEDLLPLREAPSVIGLGEMMNFPGVVHGDPSVMAKLEAFAGLPVDGHAPGLRGKELDAYLAAGVESDHECVDPEEAREKLEKGMYVYIREGSTAKNLESLLPLVDSRSADRFLLVTDDKQPEDLLVNGHLDAVLRRAVALGMDPVTALRLVTLSPARRFRLPGRGGIAPGWWADLVVLEDLRDFRALKVFKRGKLVAEKGEYLEPHRQGPPAPGAMKIAWERIPSLEIPAGGGRMRVIGVIPDQIVTESLLETPRVEKGLVLTDTERDILKACVFERHRGTGNLGMGMVRGMGLREGALASTVAHDSHNLVVVGVDDRDILLAARRVEAMGGGQVAVRGGEVIAELPLDVAGLMSTLPLEEVAARVRALREAAARLGCPLREPFMALSFLALPVIPELKMTDRGLFDVGSFRHVALFAD
ncbi:adenine deaminase [Candidatus Solincola tengchongensis]|uniref:adenine deaminase n=1 Tax=Candidatus Solincola tengchongensis TaxID=2900693 RepID=UPI00257FD432|nr:adenine deaminase [Candidatus Solincola tengchongensis]